MSDTRPLDERARALTEAALDTLEDVMENGIKDSDRVRAAESILDRGYGKAAQAIIHVPSSQRLQAQLAAMTDDQLIAVIEQKTRPVQPMIDVPNDTKQFRPQAAPKHPGVALVQLLKATKSSKDPAHEIYSDEAPDQEASEDTHPLLQ